MIGGDWTVGLLGVVVSPFWPTSCERGRDHTTMLRRQDVGAGLSGNERADSLAKTRATLPVTPVPCPLAPTIAKIRHPRYSLWRQNLWAWPNCWVSVEFLHAPIPRKESGGTITTFSSVKSFFKIKVCIFCFFSKMTR